MLKKSLLIALLAATTASYAQKIKVIEGDLKPLKGTTGFSAEFTYDNMTIGKDAKPESAYLAERKAKMNEKEAGTGDKWEQAWKSDRKDRFEPQFRELFTKHSGMSVVDDKSPYKLIFKTTRTEPGWNVGVMRVPAYIDGEAWIVDAKDASKVIAKITILKSPGQDAWGADFETGARLQEAYAKAGKELGGFIKKQTK
jgi:hypothetical protein